MTNETLEKKLDYILKNPPTWADGNPKTQVERIMEVFEQFLTHHDKERAEELFYRGYDQGRRDTLSLVNELYQIELNQ